MDNTFNWEEIQKYYDDNHTWKECMEKYNFHWGHFSKANKKGLIHSRSRTDAKKLQFKLHGTYEHKSKYNWQEIQKYYDDNHSWRECKKLFKFSWATYFKANKKGLIHSRTNQEGLDLRHKLYGYPKHTQETKDKLSKIRIKHLTEHPDQVPYLLNHYSKGDSYPETYFKELVEKEQLSLQFHKQIGLYQLDFYNEDKKVYVEIDGEQHYVDPRIVESDIRRTNYLVALGWKGYRVRWSTYQKLSYDEKHKIILEIKQLLS